MTRKEEFEKRIGKAASWM